ncbi:DNA annealing helicase and endonuclease ZRANB3 [Cyclospora cayetanensis]|uniref:DNA annealing helicase and endonuclease ZRANB3 n=1 Tax=Cyclospora cayetanensis TaxID=88456 RepID=A0A6P6RVA5_9EIME|nr:DNA annealing helicase and endonuclease ZRANB3 [Cyclospora cayetanensis]
MAWPHPHPRAEIFGQPCYGRAKALERLAPTVWGFFLQICIIRNGKTEISSQTRVVIISYDLLAKQERFQANYQCVICDESHYLKNHHAKRTQMLPDLCSYREFSDRYCLPVFNAFTKRLEDEGHQHEEELHLLLKHTVLIRRLKKDVLTELPPKLRSRIPIEISPKDLKEIRRKLAGCDVSTLVPKESDEAAGAGTTDAGAALSKDSVGSPTASNKPVVSRPRIGVVLFDGES